jgi:hypothetical protein
VQPVLEPAAQDGAGFDVVQHDVLRIALRKCRLDVGDCGHPGAGSRLPTNKHALLSTERLIGAEAVLARILHPDC